MKKITLFEIRFIQVLSITIYLVLGIFSISCGSTNELLGAGATFPQPYYNKIFDIYKRQYGIKIEYQGTGSSDGISRLIDKKIDFAGTDVIMNDAEIRDAVFPVIHIPTCIGAVVLTYNLPGNPRLKLTPDIIADIYLGKIKRWNDYRIASVNKHIIIPDININVIQRSDGSGTTYIFSEYLSKTNMEWKERVGAGKLLQWPVGEGARGNPGVAGLVKQISGSIGYVELTYAIGNNMTVASVQNSSGRFVEPCTKTVGLAAEGVLSDINFSITNTIAQYGYPISGFTWLVIYNDLHHGRITRKRADDLVKLILWVIREGQKYAEGLHYTPLPKTLINYTEEKIKTIKYKGVPVLKKQKDRS